MILCLFLLQTVFSYYFYKHGVYNTLKCSDMGKIILGNYNFIHLSKYIINIDS